MIDAYCIRSSSCVPQCALAYPSTLAKMFPHSRHFAWKSLVPTRTLWQPQLHFESVELPRRSLPGFHQSSGLPPSSSSTPPDAVLSHRHLEDSIDGHIVTCDADKRTKPHASALVDKPPVVVLMVLLRVGTNLHDHRRVRGRPPQIVDARPAQDRQECRSEKVPKPHHIHWRRTGPDAQLAVVVMTPVRLQIKPKLIEAVLAARLPDWMAREFLFDANLDLRKKAGSYRSSGQA